MLNMTQFENKYKNEIKTIANAENVTFQDAIQMLIYSCRQKDKGIHSVGEVMDFGKSLNKSFDYTACLTDFKEAIGLTEISAAA